MAQAGAGLGRGVGEGDLVGYGPAVAGAGVGLFLGGHGGRCGSGWGGKAIPYAVVIAPFL